MNMRDDIWRKFGGQETDFSGSEDYGGLIYLDTLIFLEGLMNKYNNNPVDNARTTSVILGQYVVKKVMELQRLAEIIKAASAEQKVLIRRSKQKFETLKTQQVEIKRSNQVFMALKKQLEEQIERSRQEYMAQKKQMEQETERSEQENAALRAEILRMEVEDIISNICGIM
jgi:uncharacterized protein YacL (UPF0231 family)